MRRFIAKKVFSIIFLSIFMSKMVISVAPLVIAHIDSKSMNAVIMQLEIEHPKSADVKDSAIKEFLNLNTIKIGSISPVLVLMRVFVDDHTKHRRVFYPSVPTPPPNA
ncbi:hypothetical protein B0I27_102193 [Arcticibacter pallidicorallinus]|uniref:Uncharacterized protein n=1 Tax=Arcticibacter pallidicorallinus TaxID=1259464 RepID=A0A2T0U9B7_9SPHI|nr:hypothetical protein [Arcticibacter pallidicorallinus]PRY54427.1 hypothetical protein B0I27_102193 [Arcticibacter pallidicorallinus]